MNAVKQDVKSTCVDKRIHYKKGITMKAEGISKRTVVTPILKEVQEPICEFKAPLAHPIETGSYKIQTDEMFALEDNILKSIKLSMEGTIVYGSAFTGKTFAIKLIAEKLEAEKADEFAVVYVDLTGDKYQNREFAERLARAIGGVLPMKRPPKNMLYEHLISVFTHKAMEHNGKLVLFLDEADSLGRTQYADLKRLYNGMQNNGCKLITFLVGTDALLSARDLFDASGSLGEQITRRFMQVVYPFFGITEFDSLEFVMAGYDALVYEGETFTEHFFPNAWQKGLRLADLAPVMMSSMFKITGLRQLPEIPLGYIIKIIEELFIIYGNGTTETDSFGNTLEREWIGEDEIMAVMKGQNFGNKIKQIHNRKLTSKAS